MSQPRRKKDKGAVAERAAVRCPADGCETELQWGQLLAHLREQHREACTDEDDQDYGAVHDLLQHPPRTKPAICKWCRLPYAPNIMYKHQPACKSKKGDPEAKSAVNDDSGAGSDDSGDSSSSSSSSEQAPAVDSHRASADDEDAVPAADPEVGAAQAPDLQEPGFGQGHMVEAVNMGPRVRNIPKEAAHAWQSLVQHRVMAMAALPPGDEWDMMLIQFIRSADALRRRRGTRGRRGVRTLINEIINAPLAGAHAPNADADPRPASQADPEPAAGDHESEDRSAARRATMLVEQGLASKALTVLSRRKRAVPLTPDLEGRVAEFYPVRDDKVEATRNMPAAQRITFDPEDGATRAHVRKLLYNAAAGGPSGLTPGHLKCVLRSEPLYAGFLKILERIANGEVGPAATAALQAARLILMVDVPAIDEPPVENPKLRPIAIHDILTRMACSLANRRFKDVAVAFFGRHQQGCGARGGAQAAGAHDVLALKSGNVVITMDLAAAFPRVSRQSIVIGLEQDRAQALAPLLPLISWLLSTEQAIIGGAPGSASIVALQTTGIQQGCALSPLMFCIAIHHHLRDVAQPAGVTVIGYVDNASVAGPPELATATAAALIESFHSRPTEDLTIKRSAHHVLMPTQELQDRLWSDEDRAAVDEYRATHDIAGPEHPPPTALGVPIGDDEYMRDQLVEMMARNHGRTLRALMDKKNALSTQTRTALLRYLINGAATHALRVLPPRLTRRLAQHLDLVVTEFIEQHILDVDHVPMSAEVKEAALTQARVRLSKGGLGFQSVTDIAPVAYVAGLVQAMQAKVVNIVDDAWAQAAVDECWASRPISAARKAPNTLLPMAGKLVAIASHFTDYDADEARVATNFRFGMPCLFFVGDEELGRFTDKLQKKLSEPFKREVHAKLYQHSTPAARLRLDSASGPGASAFLTCLPTSPLTTIPDLEFKIAVRLRLGAPPVDMSSLPTHCACPKRVDLSANAFHLLSCNLLCSSSSTQSLRAEWEASLWNERHAKVMRAITKLMSAAGIGVIEEPGPLNDKDVGNARAPKPDQLLSFVSLGASSAVSRVCTDVTVIECNANSKIKAKTSAVSSLNAKAYEKRTKHHDAARRAGVEFVPLVASSLGTLHESFVQFLQLEGMRLDDERLFVLFGGRRAFKTRLTDSVSCAIARGTGYVACVAAERLIYATTGHHSQVMPDVQQLNRRPRFKAKAVLRSERRQSDVARGAGPAARPESYGPEDA